MNVLKEYGVSILLLVVTFIIGVTLGFNIDADKGGIYLSVSYEDGTKMFEIGNRSNKVGDLDLNNLNTSDIQILLSEVEGLSADNGLGKKLREMAIKGSGPFLPIPISVDIHLVDENRIQGPVAKACKNSPLYGNPILAYEATSPNNSNTAIKVKGLLGLTVIWEHVSVCNSQKNIMEIWASKAYVSNWIAESEFSDSTVSVKARMIVSNLGI